MSTDYPVVRLAGVSPGTPGVSAGAPAAEPQRTPLEAATDCLAVGVLVMDVNLRVLGANEAARVLLRTRDPFDETLRGVVARTTPETAALRQAIGACRLAPHTLRFSRRPPHRPLESVISPLHDGRTAVLLLRDPEIELDLPVGVLSRLYGLTATEAAIARDLVTGHSLESAAALHGITIQTARTHLKRIFLKTETNRQAQLVAELLGGPSALLRSQKTT